MTMPNSPYGYTWQTHRNNDGTTTTRAVPDPSFEDIIPIAFGFGVLSLPCAFYMVMSLIIPDFMSVPRPTTAAGPNQVAFVGGCNVRAEPDADAEVLTYARPSVPYAVEARDHGWAQITVNNQTGWVGCTPTRTKR